MFKMCGVCVAKENWGGDCNLIRLNHGWSHRARKDQAGEVGSFVLFLFQVIGSCSEKFTLFKCQCNKESSIPGSC